MKNKTHPVTAKNHQENDHFHEGTYWVMSSVGVWEPHCKGAHGPGLQCDLHRHKNRGWVQIPVHIRALHKKVQYHHIRSIYHIL